ncbi:uncharacterized protein BT62DRAFT_966952 [Guyanagaster necrorhizus]|uniref:Protein kinase domain-containing protein n=1 Tax=Guyanagaster necrorhizus TaxID=856835 RepID=A0A9P8AUA8_9AGAR|nr:uncharacterized protein BT62DRAFT_966952 [Guyanagaster necrorhizus MCA 3950]KAG7447846.1 hypothetical protein BT62DRAFT_966952 [Guyanagaster necrorhizus MCA 3950]
MFADDLENGFRGMFSKAKLAEAIVKDHSRRQIQQDSERKTFPKLPRQEHQDVRKRGVIREWPRDPKGPLMKATPPGKVAGNNQPLWGATVLDFFRTMRMPDCPYLSTISTGSKLCAWMKEIGELGHAKDEIAWAEREAEPEELFPCDMALILRDDDHRPPIVQELLDKNFTTKEGRISAQRYLKFQNRLPLHLLPEKLIVHDPDDTLHVHTRYERPPEKRSTPRIYKLHLTQETRDSITKERERLAAADKAEPKQGKMYTTASKNIMTGKVKEGTVIEPIFAVPPPAPPTPLSTPEAHLYINSSDCLGEGNHSYVYRVGWEIPRSLVMEPYVCRACIPQALFDKLREEEPEAKIDETEPLDHQIEDLMRTIAVKHGRQGKMWIEEWAKPDEELEIVDDTGGRRKVLFTRGGGESRTFYEGTALQLPIDVKWTAPGNFCQHEEIRNRAPMTFKVSVGAKLSIKGDGHLEHEARNYQKFPEHFFQHWSGYNVIEPLHAPTPALAVVPQFYGYYVPEEGEAEDGEYLSPILLMEDCGVPVNVDELDLDDRHECVSLLFRMHCEGWLHNSFFPRNILMQHGDMSDWPICRKKEDRRFRLIDFGRSQYFPLGETRGNFGTSRAVEERDCQQMFKIINHRWD